MAAAPVVIATDGCQTSGTPLAAHLEQDAARARFVCEHPSRIRVLQLTDLHYFSAEDSTMEAKNERINTLIHTLVERTQPDLVVITGDLWPENRDGAAEQRMRYAIAQFEILGVPWAYTWGNHDQLPDFTMGYEAFSRAKNSLYRGGAASDGNYVIDITAKNQRRLLQLVCLNSKTTGIGNDQRAWLHKLAEADTAAVPRLAFFHIPIKQYDDVWTSGRASGFKGENVCLEQEDGSTLGVLKELGVRACFCGHDHVNDYSGVMDGVELVYGRSTGGYGTDQFAKGGKVIDIDTRKGTYQWFSVTPDGKMWHPTPGMRNDTPKAG